MFVRILADCLMCLTKNDGISKRANIFSKFLFIKFTKLIFLYTFKLLCAKFASNWINIEKGISMAPPNPTYLTSKKSTFQKQPPEVFCVFCKKSVLRNSAKFHRKTPVPGHFFNIIKLQAWELQLYLKRDYGTGVF